MDISANVYDLQFLTNPNLINKISNEKRLGISPEDIKFYKKRIFVLTKNYLKGKKKDRDLDKSSKTARFDLAKFLIKIKQCKIYTQKNTTYSESHLGLS